MFTPLIPPQFWEIHTHTHTHEVLALGSESHYAQLPPFIAQKLLPMGARERDLIISLL